MLSSKMLVMIFYKLELSIGIYPIKSWMVFPWNKRLHAVLDHSSRAEIMMFVNALDNKAHGITITTTQRITD